MPSESCYANPLPTFQPAMRIITAITNAFPAQVTTSFPHQFITGTIVRINIPPVPLNGVGGVGMTQINQQFGTIVVDSPTTFLIPIDTTYYDPFVIPTVPMPPPSYPYTCANVVPIGEDNSILTAATQNVLPY